MVSMIIVDDELLVCKGLSHISWETVGVQLVGTATCGMDALKLLKEYSVQILLTDIQMPDISGLELIRAANLLIPDIQSVLLTGHSNFTYAKEGISLHVFDYILKPCDPEEVLTIIGKLAKKIEAEHPSQQKSKNDMRRIQQQTFEFALAEILINHSENPDLFEILENSGFHNGNTCLIVSGITQNFHTMKNVSAFLPIAPVSFSLSVLYPNDHSIIIVIFTNHTDIDLFPQIFSFLSEFKQNIFNKKNIILQFGIGKEITSYAHLLDAYHTSSLCVDLFFSHPDHDFIFYQDVIHSLNLENSKKLQQQIITQIDHRNYVSAKECLDALELYYQTAWIVSSNIKMSVTNMCLLVAHLTAQKKNEHFSGLNAEQLLNINNSRSLNELFSFLWKILKQYIDNLNTLSDPPVHYLVNDCLHYIENHYDEDISIKIVAEEIHVNADYLSRILKKEYGSPFVQILTNYRLEKACTLLSDINIPISTVARLVGFRDFRYFGQVFKSRYKMTPSEYRKNAINSYNN